jgi:hypothetical protein
LLGRDRDQVPTLTPDIAEGHDPSEVPTLLALVALYVSDPLADTVTLSLSKGRNDGHEELAVAISDITTDVQEVESNVALAQLLDDLQGVQGRAEGTIQLGCDYSVTRLQQRH